MTHVFFRTIGIAALCCTVVSTSGQSIDDVLLFQQQGGAVFAAHGETIYRMDLDAEEFLPFASMPDRTLFRANTQPNVNSVAASDSLLWIWDSSIGSVVWYDSLGRVTVSEHWPSQTRFNHVSALRPDTGEPLVFGGYGYYRASDFFIYFDLSHREWREVPWVRGPDDPPAQMNGRLVADPHRPEVYLFEGYTALENYRSLYNIAHPDVARAFHLPSGRWRQIPMNEDVACAMRGPSLWISDSLEKGVSTFISVYSRQWRAHWCDGEGYSGLEAGSVILWQPSLSRYAALPELASFSGSTRLAAVRVKDNKLTLYQVGLSDDKEKPLRVVTRTQSLPAVKEWTPLPAPRDRAPLLQWLLGGMMLAGLVMWISWFVRFRVRLRLVPSHHEIRIRRGLIESRVTLPRNVIELLVHLCQYSPGTMIDREDLERPFSERAYNPDTLRTVTNRALVAINELGQQELGRDIVDRRPVADDKRRQEYIMTVRISVG